MIKESIVIKEITKYLESHPNWNILMERFKESPMTSQLEDMHDFERAELLADLIGLPLLGNGSNRFVVEFEGVAVKLPLWSMGIQENMQESYLWSGFEEGIQKYFLPCLGSETYFSIFPLIEPLEYEQWQSILTETQKDYEIMVQDLKACGINLHDVEFCEERYDQWALYEGRLVIIDYGDCYLNNN